MRFGIGLLLAATTVSVSCSGGTGAPGQVQPSQAPGVQASASQAPLSTFVVGVSGDVTGPLKLGPLSTGAITAYFDYMNAHGGLDGHKVKIVALDDQSNAQLAIANHKQLVEQSGAIVTIGWTASAVTTALAPALDGYKVPAIGGTLPSPLVVPAQKWFYSVKGGPDLTTAAQMAFISSLRKGAPGKIGLLRTATPSTDTWAENFKKEATSKGYSIVAEEAWPATANDVSAQVAAVLRAQPDMILCFASGEKQFFLANDAVRARAPTLPILNLNLNTSLPAILDRNDPNMYWNGEYPDLTDPGDAIKTYVAALKGTDLDPTNTSVRLFYLSAALTGEALKKCGEGCTGPKLQDALDHLSVDLKGFQPNSYGFSATNHIGNSDLIFWTVKSKQLVKAP